MNIRSIKIACVPIFAINFLLACKSDFVENKDKGERIFLAEYDGVIGTENLYLYDNDIFEIYLPNLSANGNYFINGDTILLNYFTYSGSDAPAFWVSDNHIYELKDSTGVFVINHFGSDMGIYKNRLKIGSTR